MTEPGRASRGFWAALAGLAFVALGVRLLYVGAANLPRGLGDDQWFHTVANGIANGDGFVAPFHSEMDGRLVVGREGEPIPTAFHLPLFPALLAIGSKLGFTSYLAHQVIGCICGAVTVVLIGLAGRRLGGERLGILAALAGALYVPLAINDSVTQAESLYGTLIAFVILAALRVHSQPSTGRLIALGAGIALAALTRGEGLLLLPLLAAPVVWRAMGEWRAPATRPRVRALAVTALATVVVMAPWCIRNSLAFDRPMLASTVSGSVLAGANSPRAYGDLIGAWDFASLGRTETGRQTGKLDWLDEAEQSEQWSREAREYALDNVGRLPAVAAVRFLRVWSLYPINPRDQVNFLIFQDGRLREAEWLGLACFYAAVLLSIAGFLALRRRRLPTWPFLSMVVLVSVTSVLAYGDLRLRQTADVGLMVPAAVGLEMLLVRLRVLRDRSVRAPA